MENYVFLFRNDIKHKQFYVTCEVGIINDSWSADSVGKSILMAGGGGMGYTNKSLLLKGPSHTPVAELNLPASTSALSFKNVKIGETGTITKMIVKGPNTNVGWRWILHKR